MTGASRPEAPASSMSTLGSNELATDEGPALGALRPGEQQRRGIGCALALIALVACRGEPRVARPPVGSATPVDVRSDAAPAIDAAPITAVVDAAPLRECSCFSWVHLDENGTFCYETSATCATEQRAFGRTDKLPCRPAQLASCERVACRGGGRQCFKL